jgi:hypothetical protein
MFVSIISISRLNTNYDFDKFIRCNLEIPEIKRPLERSRHRWEVGTKIELRKIGWGVWCGFTWLRIGTVGGLL